MKKFKELRSRIVTEAEDNMPASPDEAGMAMDQAKFIGYVAKEIQEYIQGGNEFPEWMQNKLTALHEKAKGMHAVMAGKYNESVQEAKFTDKQIKMAYGIANDKRYKGGNYTGAVNAIEKIAKGLSDHPAVQKVLRATNESSMTTWWIVTPITGKPNPKRWVSTEVKAKSATDAVILGAKKMGMQPSDVTSALKFAGE